jgi:hypothetical protein
VMGSSAGGAAPTRRADAVGRSREHQTEPVPVSTGCAALFLNYLHDQLRYSWQAIVTNGLPTLSETYQALTRRSADIWTDFSCLIDAYFPPGTRADATTDNVFPL